VKEAREENDVRVIAAGPNAFVYFLHDPAPLTIEQIEPRFPGLAAEIARSKGIGFVLARTQDGPVCFWRGKRYRLEDLGEGPFANRPDLDLVVAGIRDLMAMRCAGDLVLYGVEAANGHVSFIGETGAHAGPTEDEMHAFLVTPPGVTPPLPLTHPRQLYPGFVRYQEAA
jgi:hypothetical protein